MSDFEVRSGGAVAVDTETLREVAARFLRMRGDLDEITRRASSLHKILFDERRWTAEAYSVSSVLVQKAIGVGADAERISDELRAAAAVYELVELDAQSQAARVAGDDATLRSLEARRADILRVYPDAEAAARMREFERTIMWPSELVKQSTWAGIQAGGDFSLPGAVIGGLGLGGLAIVGAVVTGGTGWGRLARDARLTGGSSDVRLVPIDAGSASGATTAPTTLAGAAARVPSGTAARVRVEKYTMADGSREFVVYVAGTSTWVPGTSDPWDVTANAELGLGKESASYTATTEALEAAGAGAGDVVHAVGFSQGAMITSHLALEGDYDVRTLVTLGSPVEADVGTGTLSASVRHTDDPIVALAGGGYGTPVGAQGSFIVEAVADPDGVWTDAGAAPHSLSSYVGTASLFDESGDPRVAGVASVFERLGDAASVEAYEFGAERAESKR